MNKPLRTISYAYVGNINMHLQQVAFIEKCSINNGVLQKSVMHYTTYVPMIKIFEKHLLRASILLNFQDYNLQHYKIRDVSRTIATFKIEFFKILLTAGSC